MNNFTTKILKIFLFILVLGCVGLNVFITKDIEEVGSILSLNSQYDFVEYATTEKRNENTIKDISNVSVLDTYYGTITAYGPDCTGCSGITASGYKVAENIDGTIISTTTTYIDDTYGELRILASANVFPFGTVIRISGDRIDGYIMGIVLDRGGAMNNAWGDGEVLFDLLFATEKSSVVYEFGRQKNVKFEVLRYGR